MKLYLTMGPDGRILVQSRIELQGALAYVLTYVNQGEEFNGVGYDQLAQATPGAMDVPEQQDGSEVQPDLDGTEEPQPELEQPAQQVPEAPQ